MTNVQSVAAAAASLRQAMIDPDRARLDALIDPDLSYGHSGGRVDGKSRFIDDLMIGAPAFVSIDVADQTVKVMENIAIVRHTLGVTLSAHGQSRSININALQVWRLRGTAWKLLARQAFRPEP